MHWSSYEHEARREWSRTRFVFRIRAQTEKHVRFHVGQKEITWKGELADRQQGNIWEIAGILGTGFTAEAGHGGKSFWKQAVLHNNWEFNPSGPQGVREDSASTRKRVQVAHKMRATDEASHWNANREDGTTFKLGNLNAENWKLVSVANHQNPKGLPSSWTAYQRERRAC